jgi:hypothetical protein
LGANVVVADFERTETTDEGEVDRRIAPAFEQRGCAAREIGGAEAAAGSAQCFEHAAEALRV